MRVRHDAGRASQRDAGCTRMTAFPFAFWVQRAGKLVSMHPRALPCAPPSRGQASHLPSRRHGPVAVSRHSRKSPPLFRSPRQHSTASWPLPPGTAAAAARSALPLTRSEQERGHRARKDLGNSFVARTFKPCLAARTLGAIELQPATPHSVIIRNKYAARL